MVPLEKFVQTLKYKDVTFEACGGRILLSMKAPDIETGEMIGIGCAFDCSCDCVDGLIDPSILIDHYIQVGIVSLERHEVNEWFRWRGRCVREPHEGEQCSIPPLVSIEDLSYKPGVDLSRIIGSSPVDPLAALESLYKHEIGKVTY